MNLPEFKNITLEAKNDFAKLTEFSSYSDFNLLSLLSWNADSTNAYAVVNNNIVIKIKDYLSDEIVYSCLGKTDLAATLQMLITAFGKLKMVPEIVITNLSNKDTYQIEEDRDSFDYILSFEKLANLEGHSFKPMRRHVSHFIQTNQKYEFRKLNISEPNDLKSIFKLLESWVEDKKFDDTKLAEERFILSEFIKYAPFFNCVLLGLYIENNLIAFTFNEIISEDVVMGHFGKAINSYKGASYFIEHLTAKYFYALGYKFMNHEQDTGLEGLRTTKLTYQPIEFLKKYTITLK